MNFKALLAGVVKSAAQAGEVAVHVGVHGKPRDLAGCTPCAANARANDMYEKNLARMGQGVGKKSKPKAKAAAAPKAGAPAKAIKA